MSEEIFSGFMPMLSQVTVSEPTSMIATNGELIKAHTLNLVTKTGDSYLFSMDPNDLMRLAFLLLKVCSENNNT